MAENKVWIIDPPKKTADAGTPRSAPPRGTTGNSDRAARSHRPEFKPQFADIKWSPFLTAYIVGPLAVWAWLTGRKRVVWASIGGLSVIATVGLMFGWSQFTNTMNVSRGGILTWMIVVPGVVLTISTVWARAIIAASFCDSSSRPRYPKWMRHPWMVALLSMFVPGFGLLFSGYYRRAALTFWMIGPLALSIVILTQWQWLWRRSQSTISAGVSGTQVEIILVAAACVIFSIAMIWIVQALDGARRTTRQRSMALTDATSGALLVALVLFAATYRPTTVAQTFHNVSMSLADEGLRLVPLALCETATRLDPGPPNYIADAARYNEDLGMHEAAESKRSLLEHRLAAYGHAVSGIEAQGNSFGPTPSALFGTLDFEDHRSTTHSQMWTRAILPPR